MVLALEDLHVADAATRAFATFVARIAREERIALVLSYQPDRLTREHPLRENLAVIGAGLRPPVRVDLGPFARREIAGLIEGIEGERPSASIVVLVAERSGGSPLVVEELVAARRELRNATLTGTLADLVAARLTRRSPECRRVLRLLAPAERPLTIEELAVAAAAFEAGVASGLPPRSTSLPRRSTDLLDGDLAAGLEEAIEHGFVRRDPDDRLAIRHELVARAVVVDLLPSQRPRHQAALAHAFAGTPAIAAAYWRGAHRLDEARAAAIEAGRLAMRLEAPEDALAVLELGLDLPAHALPAHAAGHTPARAHPPRTRLPATRMWSSPSWPQRPPTPRCARRGPSPTRRARWPGSASAGIASSTPSSRLVSAGTAWRRATRRAPLRRSGGPLTWFPRSRPWSAPGSWRCSPRSG